MAGRVLVAVLVLAASACWAQVWHVGGAGYALHFNSSQQFQQELDMISLVATQGAPFEARADWRKPSCDGEAFNGLTEMTMEMWFKIPQREYFANKDKSCCVTLAALLGNSQLEKFRIALIDGGEFGFTIDSLEGVCEISETNTGVNWEFVAQQWTHVAAVYANNGTAAFKYIYVNGNLIASWTCTGFGTFNVVSSRIALGQGLGYFDGWIDEFRIWGYARTQSQIRTTMNRKLLASEVTSSVIVYYTFDNDVPVTNSRPLYVADQSSSTYFTLQLGYDGSLTAGRDRNKPDLVPSDNVKHFGSPVVLMTTQSTSLKESVIEIPLSFGMLDGVNLTSLTQVFATITSIPSTSEWKIKLSKSSSSFLSFGSLPYQLQVTSGLSIYAVPVIGFVGTSKVDIQISRLSSSTTYSVYLVSEENTDPYVGEAGSMIYCDGEDDFAYAMNFSLPVDGGFLDSFTVEFWMYFGDNVGSGDVWSISGASETSRQTYMNLERLSVARLENENDFGLIVFSDLTRLSGQWHHWAIVHDGNDGKLKVFLDGDLFGSSVVYSAVLEVQDNLGLYICKRPYFPEQATSSFQGFIDDFRFWNAARTQAEIKQYMHRQLHNLVAEDLLGLWTFDLENPGQDSSPNNNNLVFGGCTPAVEPYCVDSGCSDSSVIPSRPCYFSGSVQSIRSSSIPQLKTSTAPTSGFLKKVQLQQNSEVIVDLQGEDQDNQSIYFSITKLPTRGSLYTLDGLQLSAVGTLNDISQLKFSPAQDAGGKAYDSFEYTVSDGYTILNETITQEFAVACSAGYRLDEMGQSCQKCPPGYFKSTSSFDILCDLCPSNRYSQSSGASSCQVCETLGLYVTTDNSGCFPCPAGSYGKVDRGIYTCSVCDEGQFQDMPGQSSCKSCPSHTYSSANASECLVCSNSDRKNAQCSQIAFSTTSEQNGILSTVVIASAVLLACLSFFHYRGSSRQMFMSGLSFLDASIVGIIGILISAHLTLVEQTVATCSTKVVIFSVSAHFAFVPHLLRTYRNLKMFEDAQQLKFKPLSDRVLNGVLFGLLIIPFVLSMVWVLAFPPILSQELDQFDVYGKCIYPKSVFAILIGVYLFIVLFLSLLVSYRSIKLPVKLRESTQLIIMFTQALLVLGIIGIVVLIDFESAFGRSGNVLICLMLIYLGMMEFVCIYLPRLWYLAKAKDFKFVEGNVELKEENGELSGDAVKEFEALKREVANVQSQKAGVAEALKEKEKLEELLIQYQSEILYIQERKLSRNSAISILAGGSQVGRGDASMALSPREGGGLASPTASRV